MPTPEAGGQESTTTVCTLDGGRALLVPSPSLSLALLLLGLVLAGPAVAAPLDASWEMTAPGVCETYGRHEPKVTAKVLRLLGVPVRPGRQATVCIQADGVVTGRVLSARGKALCAVVGRLDFDTGCLSLGAECRHRTYRGAECH